MTLKKETPPVRVRNPLISLFSAEDSEQSDRRLILIDTALIITAGFMILTDQTVLLFHIIFVLLSFGAFYWKLRGFSLRVLFWVTLTTAVVLIAVLNGRTQPDELIEIPLLVSILLTVFIIASRRAKTQAQLRDRSDALKQAENNLSSMNNTLERQVAELSNRATELTVRNKELDAASERIRRLATQLEALAQVSRSIISIRDLKELLPQVASVVSEKYGFYHVGVFLVDEMKQYAILTAANSEGGQRMLIRQHRLRVGEQGIVGSVTATGEPRIALDVGQEAIYFDNPDLPETHSEMALPLYSGSKVIGALDVQSTETGAFTNDDIQTLSLLADQVSLAIENARLFEESKNTLVELQTLSRQYTRAAWSKLPEQQKLLGYRYNTMGASPLKEAIKTAGAVMGKANAKQTEAGQFVVPIELRGEVIGSLIVQSSTGSEWDSDQKDIIKAVAERVALSAENARLFEETTQRAERERLVSEITSKIRSHNDPKAMIETAVNELRNVLGASRVEIIPQNTDETDRKESRV